MSSSGFKNTKFLPQPYMQYTNEANNAFLGHEAKHVEKTFSLKQLVVVSFFSLAKPQHDIFLCCVWESGCDLNFFEDCAVCHCFNVWLPCEW